MKKIILSSLILLITVSVFAQQYVDLGLPSGTLWKDQNESGLYTYQEAEKSFGKVMPTAPQLIELVNFCTWEWTGSGYKITGPSGKSMVFPAEGYYTCGNDPSVKSVGEKGQYWSKTVSDNSSIAFPEWKFPYCLSVSSVSKEVHFNNPDCCKFSVRLVSENEAAVSKAKILQQLSESEAQAIRTEAEEQRKREEEQKRQEELRKIEAEAKQKAMEEEKRLEAECISLKDIEGNQYALIQIGDQCWMRENLRTTHYADGKEIVVGKLAKDVGSVIYSCYYPNGNPANVATYGYLYNWYTTTRGLRTTKKDPVIQGICPTGWHVPSYEEWQELLKYVSSQEQYCCENNAKKIAKAMSSTSGWETSSKKCTVGYNPSSNNMTGLSIYPAGDFLPTDLGFAVPLGAYNFGKEATFWSSSWNKGVGPPKGIVLCYNETDVDPTSSGETKLRGFSVRCLRGEGVLANAVVKESGAASMEEIQARRAQDIQSTLSTVESVIDAVTPTVINAALGTPASNNPAVGNVPAATSGSDYSNSSGSSVSQWVSVGTATGIKITESGSVSSISCPVESWNNSGPPSALIDGEHYQLVRSSSSTCSGVSVSQYSYFCHVTSGSRILYTVYVNF